jgi:carboxymethylenebutenolidase
MSRRDVTITTPDGEARAYAFTPSKGAGPWPGVIVFMDALAIRPAMFEIAERIAEHGYYVLLPDMFWRLGAYEPIVPKEILADRGKLAPFMASTNPEKAMSDTGAFLDWLTAQPQVKGLRVGTTGYCMGGAMSLRAAAAYPNHVAAAASFHGGNLATEKPDSPHLLAQDIKAKVLVAGADKDAGFTLDDKAKLEQSFKDAGVDADVSIWPDMLHGWVPRDMPVFDAAGAERHYEVLLKFYDEALG